MKKLFILFSLLVMFSSTTKAQGFGVEYDTVYITYAGISNGLNHLTSLTTDVKVGWHVLSTDFPADWLNTETTFCDKDLCWPMLRLWPSGLTITPTPYTSSVLGTFRYYIDLTNATTIGSHYVTLKFFNVDNPIYNATQTYIITLPE